MNHSMGAWREDGFERRQSRSGDRTDADRTMDLLDCLHDVDAGEGEPKRRPDPLDRGRGANHEGPADGGA